MAVLTARERYQAVMRFQPGVRTLLWEYAYWNGAVERWYHEGLQRSATSQPPGMPSGEVFHGEGLPWPARSGRCCYRDVDIHRLLDLDEGTGRIPVNWRCSPPFEKVVLDEDETTQVLIDSDGARVQVRKDRDSLPHPLEWPVRDWATWQKLKEERFGVDVRARLPDRWEEVSQTYGQRDYPLGVIVHGLFGLPRDLMGLVAQCTMYYTEPKLMHDVSEHLTSVFLAVLEEVCARVDLDFVYVWEDLAYKNGPLISPWLFDEFIVPYYKRLTGFLRARGIDIVCVDTDGDFRLLIPGFLEGGVTGFYPFEVMAGMDVVAVRKEYPQLHIQGGLDKTKLAAGKASIDSELEAKLPYMLSQGGYIPFCDHLVPPDVSWESFLHYRTRLREYVEKYPSTRR